MFGKIGKVFERLFNTKTYLLNLLNVDSPNWTDIRRFIQSNNHVIKTTLSSDNSYMLHYACWKNAPSNLVIELIHKYPKAVQESDNNGWYPLHIACRKDQSESVVLLLIDNYIAAVKERNEHGSYPLHIACGFNQSKAVVVVLIDKFSNAIREADNYGDYPLHCACAGNASLSVIQYIAKQWSGAIYETKKDGKTPLDWAKQPFENTVPNNETINWLENCIQNGFEKTMDDLSVTSEQKS